MKGHKGQNAHGRGIGNRIRGLGRIVRNGISRLGLRDRVQGLIGRNRRSRANQGGVNRNVQSPVLRTPGNRQAYRGGREPAMVGGGGQGGGQHGGNVRGMGRGNDRQGRNNNRGR